MARYLINAIDLETEDNFHGNGKVFRNLAEAERFAEMLAVRGNSDFRDIVINIHPISFWGNLQRSIATYFSDPALVCIDLYTTQEAA